LLGHVSSLVMYLAKQLDPYLEWFKCKQSAAHEWQRQT